MFPMLTSRGYQERIKSLWTTLKLSRKLNQIMEPKPILYGDVISPPVRFALMTAKALGTDLDFRKVHLFASENKSKAFKEINPLQKVPALVIGKEVIRDSHAIAVYLCERSDKQDLYPTDVVMKGRVNDMLFFNASALFPVDSIILTDFFAGKWPADKKHEERWNFFLDYLNKILGKSEWLAGNKITLADLCCAATISSLNLLIPLTDEHTFLVQWLKRLHSFPFFAINTEGINVLQGYIDGMKPKK